MTSIFEQYYGGAEYVDQIRERVTFTKRSALHLFDYGVYDKVLYFANFNYRLRLEVRGETINCFSCLDLKGPCTRFEVEHMS